jgi:hypothetical protein
MELLIALILGMIAFTGLFYTTQFVSKQIAVYIERHQMYTEINYAFEDMQLRLPSAIRIVTTFLPDEYQDNPNRAPKEEFVFEGEKDIFKITPDNDGDNVIYKYAVTEQGFMLYTIDKTTKAVLSSDVLVDGKFKPKDRPMAQFTRAKEDGTDMIMVILTAMSTKAQLSGVSRHVSKVESIKFWFVDAVK